MAVLLRTTLTSPDSERRALHTIMTLLCDEGDLGGRLTPNGLFAPQHREHAGGATTLET